MLLVKPIKNLGSQYHVVVSFAEKNHKSSESLKDEAIGEIVQATCRVKVERLMFRSEGEELDNSDELNSSLEDIKSNFTAIKMETEGLVNMSSGSLSMEVKKEFQEDMVRRNDSEESTPQNSLEETVENSHKNSHVEGTGLEFSLCKVKTEQTEDDFLYG